MGRRPREEEPDGVYHVIQRGNNREFVFGEDDDKEYLTWQLMNISGKSCDIYGFVIMGNHYHIVLRTVGETLQSTMHRLNLKYSKYFNLKYTRSGHVFQGRYKAIPVRDDKYILSLLRYVHQNPVKAGVCNRVEEYKWSSDSYYRRSDRRNGWIDTEFLLKMFSTDLKIAKKKYKEFMAEEETSDYENKPYIGSTPAQKEENNEKKTALKSLDEILLATGVTQEEFKLVKSGSRRRNLTAYKLEYIRNAMELNYTLKAIGKNINVSEVAIFDNIKRNNLSTRYRNT